MDTHGATLEEDISAKYRVYCNEVECIEAKLKRFERIIESRGLEEARGVIPPPDKIERLRGHLDHLNILIIRICR